METKFNTMINAMTETNIDKMKSYLIETTIRDINIDPTFRINLLTDDEVIKEYKTILSLSFWD